MSTMEISSRHLDPTATGMIERPTSKGSNQMVQISQHDTGSEDASVIGRRPQWITRRRLLLVSVTIMIGSGMALNWGWLTAAGLAPILVSLAPCGVMCGLGLCMKGGTGTSWSSRLSGIFR